MARETEVGVAGDEHLLVDRAVRVMAARAAVAHRTMLINKRSSLGSVAFRAALVLGLKRCGRRGAAVDIVTVHAGDMAIHHRVAVGQAKLTAFIEMACETRLGRLARVDDVVTTAASLRMQAAWAVTGLAAGVADLGVGDGEIGMAGRAEVIGQIGVTLGALLTADKISSRNIGRRHDGASGYDTRDQEEAPESHSSVDERCFCPAEA